MWCWNHINSPVPKAHSIVVLASLPCSQCLRWNIYLKITFLSIGWQKYLYSSLEGTAAQLAFASATGAPWRASRNKSPAFLVTHCKCWTVSTELWGLLPTLWKKFWDNQGGGRLSSLESRINLFIKMHLAGVLAVAVEVHRTKIVKLEWRSLLVL